MTKRIVKETTDGKYVGLVFEDTKPLISPDGIEFKPTSVQNLGNGYKRYSNSHYVVLTEEYDL